MKQRERRQAKQNDMVTTGIVLLPSDDENVLAKKLHRIASLNNVISTVLHCLGRNEQGIIKIRHGKRHKTLPALLLEARCKGNCFYNSTFMIVTTKTTLTFLLSDASVINKKENTHKKKGVTSVGR